MGNPRHNRIRARQITTRRNPSARGFVVTLLERDISRDVRDETGALVQSSWTPLERFTAGTKRNADSIHAALLARFTYGPELAR
jgi:hypothetical protein